MQVNIADHECTIIWDGVYYFALSNYPNISAWELQKLRAFIDYESHHGRKTEIICDNEHIMAAVNEFLLNPCNLSVMPPTKITECTACKYHGCLTEFVCHTASIENAKKILSSGKLLSAVKAFDKSADEIVAERVNDVMEPHDPPDFFEYVMFTWGNCQAGDNIIMQRKWRTLLTVEKLEKDLTPGVRFYFKYSDIINHPKYVFDGYHPAKIKNEFELWGYLYACIVPELYRDDVETLIEPNFADKVHYIPQDNLGIWDWSERVYEFITKLSQFD